MAKADLKKKVVLDIPTTEEEKKKALQSAIAHITKVYGTGAIMRLGENKANLNVEAIPTGSMMLDMALGIGGVPRGRIVELYGPVTIDRKERMHSLYQIKDDNLWQKQI